MGNEAFSYDKKTGKKKDAHIHEGILNGIDPADEYQLRLGSARYAAADKSLGISRERAAEMYHVRLEDM